MPEQLSNGHANGAGGSQDLVNRVPRAWWKEASVYQIYPSSFKDSNGDGIGDIPGIISKLDYIKQLGVDIVWLSPIFKSPQADMGYDISDYCDIHEPYGTIEDVDELIRGLHSRGMKCILDLVVNHTSDQHDWFKQSRSSLSNSHREWYIWRKPKYDSAGKRQPPNNWKAIFGGSAWEYDEQTDEYYLHLFLREQPDLNWDYPPVRDAVCNVMRFWLDRGCDGFRIDAINFISKSPGLPDDTSTNRWNMLGLEHYANGPRLHEYLKVVGGVLREYNAFSVGEMGHLTDLNEVLRSVGADRGELAMVFHFEIMDMDNGPVNRWQTFMLEKNGWNALYLENHDQSRSVSRFGSDKPQYRSVSAKMLATYLGFQSGTLFLYQGQELAMANVPLSWGIAEYKDVATQNYWNELIEEHPDDKELARQALEGLNKKSRDSARTPVQWDSSQNAGFTTGKPWMRVDEDYPKWNAESQVKASDSVFHYYRTILQVRKEYKDIFVYGEFELLAPDDQQLFVYKRTSGSTAAVVVLNFKETEITVRTTDLVGGTLGEVLLSNYSDLNVEGPSVSLGPFGAFVALLS
ncbi:MAG: hypothetical protein LQ347_003152 [Umbilicaria vellea]|nr:MAG: hypothetical protein LQ347_003152 [Umbilicaria vellea]